MPNLNRPISKEEYESWRSDPVTQTMLYTLADTVGEAKESLIFYDADQTLEQLRLKQGFIEALLQVLEWKPVFSDE